MKIVTFLNYDNKMFLITKDKNQLVYSIKEDKNYRLEITQEEKEIFDKMVDLIVCDKDESIFMKVESFGDRFYKLFYNPTKKIYYTDSEDLDIISYVNLTKNNISRVAHAENIEEKTEKNTKKKDSKFFERALKIGNKVAFAGILATLSLNPSSPMAVKEFDNVRASTLMPGEIEAMWIKENRLRPEYNFVAIESIIDENANLSKEEKEKLKLTKMIFEENHQYMDLAMVHDRLKNLKIEYNPSPDDNVNYLGEYNYGTDTITFNHAGELKDVNLTTVFHELIHLMQDGPSADILQETFTEMLARETMMRLYDSKQIKQTDLIKAHNGEHVLYGTSYETYMPITYMLAECLDRETIKKYTFNCDNRIIIDKLAEGTDARARANGFMNDLNSLREDNGGTWEYVEDEERLFEELNRCYNGLNYFYELKNGYPMKDNLNITINLLNDGRMPKKKLATPYTEEQIKVIEDTIVGAAKGVYKDDTGIIPHKYLINKTYFSDHRESPIMMFPATKNRENFKLVGVEINKTLAEEIQNRIGDSKAKESFVYKQK